MVPTVLLEQAPAMPQVMRTVLDPWPKREPLTVDTFSFLGGGGALRRC
jgi:hypothetical protein